MLTIENCALPATPAAFHLAITKAISSYLGEAIAHDQKLDAAIAASLDVAFVPEQPDEVETYPISFDSEGDQYLIINGVRIEQALADDGFIHMSVFDREEKINDLRVCIGEAVTAQRHSDVHLMQQDLETLLSSGEEYVLGYVNASGFVASDVQPELFNQECDAILKAAADYYQMKVGQLTKTGHCYGVCLDFWLGYEIRGLYAGELVMINKQFLNDETFPVGMAVEKLVGELPENYVAAYMGDDGEWELVDLCVDLESRGI